MYIDYICLFTTDIAAQMRAFVNHQACLALFAGKMCKSGTEEARINNQIVVFHVSK